MGLADQIAMRERAVETALDDSTATALSDGLASLEAEGRSELLQQGVAAERIKTVKRVHIRYEGTDSALIVPFDSLRKMREHRSEEHTSELQSLMRISYAVFCLKNKNKRK